MPTSTEPFSTLLTALQHRIDLVSDRAFFEKDPDAHLKALQQAAQQVELAFAALPEPVDPQLRHFIERQSFLKAIDWLKQATATPSS